MADELQQGRAVFLAALVGLLLLQVGFELYGRSFRAPAKRAAHAAHADPFDAALCGMPARTADASSSRASLCDTALPSAGPEHSTLDASPPKAEAPR